MAQGALWLSECELERLLGVPLPPVGAPYQGQNPWLPGFQLNRKSKT